MRITQKMRRFIEIVNHCCTLASGFKEEELPITIESLQNDRDFIIRCIEAVNDLFVCEGLERNWEPNTWGIELEDTVDFLLEFLYALEDKNSGK